jgi:hypothetical protein
MGRWLTIQVKAADFSKQHDGNNWLGFGYSTNYLREGKSFFNSKDSPLLADIVVAVGYKENASQCVVQPVAFAEKLCRVLYSIPARKRDTMKLGKRSQTFPIYLCFDANRVPHRQHHERIKRNLRAFQDKWQILNAPIQKLRKSASWVRTEP